MGESGKAQAPKIAELLQDPDQGVSLNAIWVIRKMGDPLGDYTEIFTELLKSANDLTRFKASHALGEAGSSASAQIPDIVELLVSNDIKLRVTAAYTLGSLGENAKAAIPNIEELLKNQNPVIRSSGLKALGNMGANANQQIQNIIVLLSDPDRDVRADAAWALGEINSLDENQISELAQLLNDKDSKVRYITAQALGKIGPPAGIYAPKVSELLNDQDELVSTSAAIALGNLGPKSTEQAPQIGSFIQQQKKDQKANRIKIVAGVETLSKMGNSVKEQGPIVAELLMGANMPVRSSAVRALQQMAPLDKDTVLIILASSYQHPADIIQLRLLAHLAAGGNQDSETLISWLGRSKKKTASKRDIENSSQTLNILLESWEFTESHPEMRDDLVVAISEVAKNGNWTKEDLVTLKKAEDTLKSKAFTDQANIISTKIGELGG